MSFRIDLCNKDGVRVFLVVVRDQININFSSNDKLSSYSVRNNFTHLQSKLALTNEQNMVRGADPEHIKRHHVVSEETQTPHTHMNFNQDVTPLMLKEFLVAILNAQVANKDDKYQFFNAEVANDVLRAFAAYHKEFVSSKLQKQFLAERQLTQQEKISLAQHAATEVDGTLATSDKHELAECGVKVEPPAPVMHIPFQALLRLMFLASMGSAPESAAPKAKASPLPNL